MKCDAANIARIFYSCRFLFPPRQKFTTKPASFYLLPSLPSLLSWLGMKNAGELASSLGGDHLWPEAESPFH